MERLQKVIANLGVTSRRKAEELINEGKVKVNGEVITELGYKVSDTDIIEVLDKIINKEVKKEYYLLYKPSRVITSTSDEKGRKTVVDLIDTEARIYPVGRLDYDTTGALILTNDGELANILMHPTNKIPKTYLARIDGFLNKDDIERLKLTIVEGRNHIVKRIFASLNHKVLKLKRTKIAFLNLEGLKIGEYRPLKLKEIEKLYSLK